MTYQWQLENSEFSKLKKDTAVVVCNVCSEKLQYYVYCRQSKTNCHACTTELLKSKGSLNKLLQATKQKPDSETENVSKNDLLPLV